MLRAHRILFIALAVMLATGSGCQPNPAPASPRTSPGVHSPRRSLDQPPGGADGCDAQLHDISGLFLLYSQQHRRLPQTLEELGALPQATGMSFKCPVSGETYLYDPDGKPAPSGAGRVVLYDAAPSHSGMRMAITLSQTPQSDALVTKVIALPDAFFQK